MRLLVGLLIIVLTQFAQAKLVCGDLFSNRTETLITSLRMVNAEADLNLYDKIVETIFENLERAQRSDREVTTEAAEAILDAAFNGQFLGFSKKAYVHEGLIEKRAVALIKKLDALFDPDVLGSQPKEIRHVILKARISLAVVGIKRFAEMQGLKVIPHWSFSSFTAIRTTLWHDILTPPFNMIFGQPGVKPFSPEVAFDMLWKGIYSPGTLIWGQGERQNDFLKLWTWWSNVRTSAIVKLVVVGAAAGGIFLSGMTYKAYIQSSAERAHGSVEQSFALKSLEYAMRADLANSIYADTIKIYIQQNAGKEPSKEYLADLKRKLRSTWPDTVFFDEQ